MKRVLLFSLSITFILVMLQSTSTFAQPTMTAPAKPAVMTTAKTTPKPTPKPAPMSVMAKPAPAAPVAPAMTAAPTKPVAAVSAMTAVPTQPVMSAAPTTKATAPKKDSKGSVIAGWLLNIILAFVGTVATTLGGVVIKWVWQKYQLDKYIAADKVDEMVDKAIIKGINYAEEQANKLKDDPVDGAKKMDLALGVINKSLKDSGIEKKAADYLATLVEAKLPEIRVAGTTELVKKEEKPVETKEEPKEEKTAKKEEKKEKTDG